MTQFAYYHTPDNTIAEMELDYPTVAAAREVAIGYGEAYEFKLIGIFNDQWNDSKWDHEYARLERYGYFTRERQEELFDTPIAGTLDRIDTSPLQPWEIELLTGTDD